MPLQDTDNLIVGRGTDSYKITYEDLKDKLEEDGLAPTPPDPVEIKKPVVLSPANGAGIGGDVSYFPETSAITAAPVSQPDNSQFIGGNSTLTSGTAYENGAFDWDGVFKPDTGLAVVQLGNASGNAIATYNFPAEVNVSSVTFKAQMASGGNGLLQLWATDAGGSKFAELAFDDTLEERTIQIAENQVLKTFQIRQTGGGDYDIKLFNMYFDGEPWDAVTAELTFENNKAFDSETGDEMSTIDKVFKAGDKVVGEGDATVFADSPAFSTYIYDGNGQPDRDVTTGIDNTVKSLVWVKLRTHDTGLQMSHALYDTVRGPENRLHSDKTDAAALNQDNELFEFTNDGFKYGISSLGNNSQGHYVAWNFRGAPGFFDVVTYNGTGSVKTVPHSLMTTPGFIVCKKVDDNGEWYVYHKSTGATQKGALQDAAAFTTGSTEWNDTEPTEDVFTVGTNYNVNESGKSYVAYLFADTPGKIKCGKYNGSSNAVTVDCGFEPEFLLVKAYNTSRDWGIFDLKRNGDSTFMGNTLFSNKSDSEVAYGDSITTSSSGFTIAAPGPSTPSAANDAGLNFVYVAIAKDASAGQFMPTGVLTEDAAGTSMTLTDVTGEWKAGLTAVNETEATETAPGADDIEFKSDKPVATSGEVTSWGLAKWELTNTDTSAVQIKEVTLTETDVVDGPTDFTLEANTTYSVRVGYSSSDPEATVQPVYSDVSNFKTAGASGGAYGNFSTTLYTGNGNSPQFIPTGIDNTVKSLAWFKNRDAVQNHRLYDTIRGDKAPLYSNQTNEEGGLGGGLTFESNGIQLDSYDAGLSDSGQKQVVWNFAAAPGFFDVVTWDGVDGGVARTENHALNAEPGFVICKSYTQDGTQWYMYHKSLSEDAYLRFTNGPKVDSPGAWQDMTTTTFGFGTAASLNAAGRSHVAYLFADNPDGGIKCGSYPGAGTGNSNPVAVGFRPGWVLIKKSSGSDNWMIFDKARGAGTSGNDPYLVPNNNEAEVSNANRIEFTDTGFNVITGNMVNEASQTFIYVAIADTTVIFYDENTASTVTNHTLTKRYGVDPLETDLRKFGIYPLTEQPDYSVDTYVKVGESYKPIRNYSSEMRQLEDARSRLASIESDEINDDATDTALLTLLANLTQRVTDLEQSN